MLSNWMSGRARRGQATVEFALGLTVAMYLIMGVVDFGRAFFVYNELANAAREGARYGVLTSRTTSQIQSYVNTKAPISGLSTTVTPATRTSGSPIVVQVSYSFVPITPLISAVCCGGGSLALSAKSSMIVEQ